jgi:uncharacterized protein (TIGR02271 family)
MTSAADAQLATDRDPAAGVHVVGDAGLRGIVQSAEKDRTQVLLDDGRRVSIRTEALQPRDDGFYVALSPADVSAADGGDSSEERVIPILEEQVRVEVASVVTGRVRIAKRVETETHEVDQPLLREDVDVERIEVNTPVEDAANPPQPRQEGDTLIIPVLKEVLVVEKRLVVAEELRVTRKQTQHVARETVELRREHVDAERLDTTV